jgi:hypothetical protein
LASSGQIQLVDFRRVRHNAKFRAKCTMEKLVGFGLACAPVRCAHPSFWAHCHAKRGAARPPAHRSLAASYSSSKKMYYFQKVKLPSGPSLGRQGRISFHWTTEALKYNIPHPSLHLSHPISSKLRCTLLSFVAS